MRIKLIPIVHQIKKNNIMCLENTIHEKQYNRIFINISKLQDYNYGNILIRHNCKLEGIRITRTKVQRNALIILCTAKRPSKMRFRPIKIDKIKHSKKPINEIRHINRSVRNYTAV